jgi:hypothetical protein
VKIDEQAETFVRETEISQQLLFVNRRQILDGFQQARPERRMDAKGCSTISLAMAFSVITRFFIFSPSRQDAKNASAIRTWLIPPAESYRYRLSDKGAKAALMFVLFHQRVRGPLANSIFHHKPDETLKPRVRSKKACRVR